MRKIVVLSGAGISAESGISTFRDANGLWETHDIMEVASLQGWKDNPQLVLDFYNVRRSQLNKVNPNTAHYFLAQLEKDFNVVIVTQNVDDLHERAGSTNVIHLHGELRKARSVENENLIIDWITDIHLGDFATDGCQLRPHIVWFGEQVPMMDYAIDEVQTADVLLVVGTSLQVYPAASLLYYTKKNTKIICIDPNELPIDKDVIHIKKKATEGILDINKYL